MRAPACRCQSGLVGEQLQAAARYCIFVQMSHSQSSRDSDGFAEVYGWRCPVCDATAYRQTLVNRPNGGTYLTEFYECAGCTLMFRHPGRFARLGLPVRRWAMDVEPRSLRQVHGFSVEEGATDSGKS